MSDKPDASIPVLTEVVADQHDPEPLPPDMTSIVAELQTRLAADTFALLDDVLRTLIAELEAHLFEQLSARLRQRLPELMDSVLREYLDADRDMEDEDRQ
jgi:hypothetical protein